VNAHVNALGEVSGFLLAAVVCLSALSLVAVRSQSLANSDLAGRSVAGQLKRIEKEAPRP